MSYSARWSQFVITGLFLLGQSITAWADEPLHTRIDQLISAKAVGPSAEITSDAEFVRRIYLDLAGKIPSAGETRTFLADSSTEKREKLVDQLLNAPEYSRRMSEAFHVMLMERLGENEEWSKFLTHAFETNMPWDEIVRQMMNPDTENEKTRGSAFFLTKRLENYGQNPVDLPALTRDLGRLFLGVDLQCAQCHDHPHIKDYKQHDFQGVFAFVGHTFIRRDKKFPAIGEKVITKKIEFESVFIPGKKQTGPRLPGGQEFEVLKFKKGEEFALAPDKTTKFPGVPKFSPLSILAKQLPQKDNHAFAMNAVNRLWFVMMGRGIVHPLDLRHSANPPSHPELLKVLADEFTAHQFDIKWLLREIAYSKTYQRSSLLPDGVEKIPIASFQVAIEKSLSAEQLMWSMLEATGESKQLPDRNKQQPVADSKKKATVAKESKESKESETVDKLTDYRKRFGKAFANPPREPEVEFAPSVKAALFVLNDSAVLDWLTAKPGNLVDRLTKLNDQQKLTEELYISVFSRMPTDDEQKMVVDYIKKKSDDGRTTAIGYLVWSLLSSNEFCLNH